MQPAFRFQRILQDKSDRLQIRTAQENSSLDLLFRTRRGLRLRQNVIVLLECLASCFCPNASKVNDNMIAIRIRNAPRPFIHSPKRVHKRERQSCKGSQLRPPYINQSRIKNTTNSAEQTTNLNKTQQSYEQQKSF